MPKALQVRILKTRATRAVAALPAMMVSVLTKKGRQLPVRAALPNSVIQSAKFVIFPAYPSPRLNLFRLDDISDSFTAIAPAERVPARDDILHGSYIHPRQEYRPGTICPGRMGNLQDVRDGFSQLLF